MENRDRKGVFLHTMKIDSELMVRCLLTILNHLPDIKFTAIFADEASLGYRVHFSSPEDETVLAVLALPQLMVCGRNIQIIPLNNDFKNTFISRNSTMSDESEIDKLSEKFGKEEIIKEGYYNPRNNQMIELEYENKAGTSGKNLPNVSHHKEEIHLESDDDDDDDDDDNDDMEIQMVLHQTKPESTIAKPKFSIKKETGLEHPGKYSNASPPENPGRSNTDGPLGSPGPSNADLLESPGTSNLGPPESPGSANIRRRSLQPSTAVEDMSVLSKPLNICIDRALAEFNIISRKDLQSFLRHCKKKSNVVEVARKYVKNEYKLRTLLQHICKLHYSTSQSTKEDKRFIKCLEERTERFGKKVPPKGKSKTS